MSKNRLIHQVQEVVVRRMAFGDADNRTGLALNLLQQIFKEDYPDKHNDAVKDGLDLGLVIPQHQV